MTRESFSNRRGVSAAKKYALRAMIALTTSIQLRDKACVLELLIEGPVIYAQGTRDLLFTLARARIFYAEEICIEA